MSALDDFLDDHRLRPWACYGRDFCNDRVPGRAGGDAPAKALHEAYQTYMADRDPELKVMGQPAFGAEVKSRSWTSWRREAAGVFYEMLTAESREDRATAETRSRLLAPARRIELDRLLAEGQARHVAREHADGPACDQSWGHSPGPDVLLRLHEMADAAVAAMPDPPQLADVREEMFGAYLRWRPTDLEPSPAEGGHHHRQLPEERGDQRANQIGDSDQIEW